MNEEEKKLRVETIKLEKHRIKTDARLRCLEAAKDERISGNQSLIRRAKELEEYVYHIGD